MMHKSEEYSLDDVLKHIRIEEETLNQNKRGKSLMSANSLQAGNFKGKGKVVRSGIWVHKRRVLRNLDKNQTPCKGSKEPDRKSGPLTTNTVAEIEDLVENLSMEEINMLAETRSMVMASRGGWFLDTGATIHVCDSKSKFTEYHDVNDGKQNDLYVGKAYRDRGMYRLSLKDNAEDLDDDSDGAVGEALPVGDDAPDESAGSNVMPVDDGSNGSVEGLASGLDEFVFLSDEFVFSGNVILGYAKNSKAYRLLNKESRVIVESGEVEFFKDKFSEDVETSERTLDSNLPGTSRDRTQKKVTREVIFSINIDDDPKTFKEAMSSRDASLWKEAINDEMDSIMGNGTWVLIDLPKGSKPIGSKWIFKRKRHPDGTVPTFKARLVAKGYRHREGMDYFDIYAPVARISSIRSLIAISSLKGLYIHQMDVKTTFLNGYLNEEVYMEQPKEFVMPGQENKVCRLVKSLYGLKQAPK
ncbi:hypothetical protein OSB04_002637 [Centaurea solstitialis]|uniref:Reverse transcriptase Ty1/copia-type domain-containing protein n=1 Tax=Centaurea solstitialis TaxID=347529 RepID=A0AA38U5W2_9ASTR|nr:hypothetical protein OSB04_002637 [Centaurea solstitialis]